MHPRLHVHLVMATIMYVVYLKQFSRFLDNTWDNAAPAIPISRGEEVRICGQTYPISGIRIRYPFRCLCISVVRPHDHVCQVPN